MPLRLDGDQVDCLVADIGALVLQECRNRVFVAAFDDGINDLRCQILPPRDRGHGLAFDAECHDFQEIAITEKWRIFQNRRGDHDFGILGQAADHLLRHIAGLFDFLGNDGPDFRHLVARQGVEDVEGHLREFVLLGHRNIGQ